jgi:hypothetical protein
MVGMSGKIRSQNDDRKTEPQNPVTSNPMPSAENAVCKPFRQLIAGRPPFPVRVDQTDTIC